MSAAAQHYPRRAGVSLQLGGGMAPTGAATTTIEQRRRLKGAHVWLSTTIEFWLLSTRTRLTKFP
jgi:hypothetical protein